MKCFRCHSQVRLKDMPGRLVKLGRLESMPGRLVKPGRRGPRVQAALGAGFVMIGETGEVGVVFFRRRDIHWHVGSGPQAPASQDLSLAVGSGAVDVATGGEYVRAVEDPGCHERRYHDYGIRFRVRQVLHVAPLGVEDFHMRDEVEVWQGLVGDGYHRALFDGLYDSGLMGVWPENYEAAGRKIFYKHL